MVNFKRRPKNSSTPPRRRTQQSRDSSLESPRPQTSYTYRRNQTLSGVAKPDHSDVSSPRSKAHSLAMQRRRLSGIFAIVIACVVLLVLLLTQLIAQVTVSSSTRQLSQPFMGEAYEKSINDYLARNPAERLRFALNQDALTQFVAAELPEVESLEIKGSLNFVNAQFAITFREPVAGWQMDGRQYYVDHDGVVFDKNYYNTTLVQIVDQSGISPEQGTVVAGSRLLSFLGKVVAQAKGRGLVVTQAVLPAGTTRQLDITLEGNPTRVKLTIDRGAGEQSEDMARALTYMQQNGIGAEYVDVRVSGRAAYR